MSDLITWWKSLHHNNRKMLLIHLDFQKNKIAFDYLPPYDHYKKEFGIGIRKRLDNFEITEENLLQIVSLEELNIKLDASIINRFKNLRKLNTVVPYPMVGKNVLLELDTVKIEHLHLKGRFEDINGIDKFRNLKELVISGSSDLLNLDPLINCHELRRFELSLNLNPPLTRLYFSVDPRIKMETLIIPFHWIYSYELMDIHFSKRRNLFKDGTYEFCEEEIQFILENADENIKENFKNFILSNKFTIHVSYPGIYNCTLQRKS